MMNSVRLTVGCLLLVAMGCSGKDGSPPTITLATTTSTRDSGLLDALVPMFEKQTGIEVKMVAVGSGQALELGRRGDADAILTHAPDAEKEFMAQGFGEERLAVMHNDFVLVGPTADPVKIAGGKSITLAFARIAGSNSPFVSRGDESGTHLKERRIWQQAEIEPDSPWYLQAGMGMANVLRMADQKNAYTLSDRGTFLAQRRQLDLTVLCEGDPLLQNDYSVILVKHDKLPHVNREPARRFVDFLLSRDVQKMIGDFGVDKFGEPLFFPRPDINLPVP